MNVTGAIKPCQSPFQKPGVSIRGIGGGWCATQEASHIVNSRDAKTGQTDFGLFIFFLVLPIFSAREAGGRRTGLDSKSQ